MTTPRQHQTNVVVPYNVRDRQTAGTRACPPVYGDNGGSASVFNSISAVFDDLRAQVKKLSKRPQSTNLRGVEAHPSGSGPFLGTGTKMHGSLFRSTRYDFQACGAIADHGAAARTTRSNASCTRCITPHAREVISTGATTDDPHDGLGKLTSASEGPCLWLLLLGDPRGDRVVPLLPGVIANRASEPSLRRRTGGENTKWACQKSWKFSHRVLAAWLGLGGGGRGQMSPLSGTGNA